MKLGEIAQRLECKLEGDAGIDITGVAGIEEAAPGQLTFLAAIVPPWPQRARRPF
jgi:UDP-3-O-[3-hydroxymyristoyl] glucosamine N-acyltransferase